MFRVTPKTSATTKNTVKGVGAKTVYRSVFPRRAMLARSTNKYTKPIAQKGIRALKSSAERISP